MRQIFQKIYARFRNLILYGVIGCLSSSLDFCIYTLLLQVMEFHYILANCISVLAGITTSFLLNRKYNFKVTDHAALRFTVFLSVGLMGMLFSNLILYVGIGLMHYDGLLTKLLSIVLVVFFQFLLNKYVTFRERPNNRS